MTRPDWPSCTVSADVMPLAVTASVSAWTVSDVAKFAAAKVPAPSSNACRRDKDCGSALSTSALTICLDGLEVLQRACGELVDTVDPMIRYSSRRRSSH